MKIVLVVLKPRKYSPFPAALPTVSDFSEFDLGGMFSDPFCKLGGSEEMARVCLDVALFLVRIPDPPPTPAPPAVLLFDCCEGGCCEPPTTFDGRGTYYNMEYLF